MNNERNIVVVRLTTSIFKRGGRYVYEKSLSYLKSKSTMRLDDLMCDYEYDIHSLLNSNQQPDGLYELRVTNESRCWETGIVDDWDLCLFPWCEELTDEGEPVLWKSPRED